MRRGSRDTRSRSRTCPRWCGRWTAGGGASERGGRLMDSHHTIASIFGSPRALIGMVHVGALPGTPAQAHGIASVVETAVAEARMLNDAGFQGVMIENMHDRPYPRRVAGPEIVAAMAAIGREIRREVPIPLGVQ